MSLLQKLRLPATRPSILQSVCKSCATSIQQAAPFSTSPVLERRGKARPKTDPRIKLIRYFLQHPLTPRPLRFSRNRYLRHWTIHRAWHLYQAKLRKTRELELERQYNSMREACEALRLMDGNGMTVDENSPVASDKSVGKLYRIAMLKHNIWNGVPIEYARIQTDSPPRDGWNHDWKR